jgi:hypothetical protein
MTKPLAVLALLASAALASCSSNTLTKVDLAAENHPPLPVTVAGTGITISAGIGVAFVATLSVNNKTTNDKATIASSDENCVVSDGINKNEFFMVCNAAGTGSLVVSDGEPGGTDDGTLKVPVTIMAQPGSMMLPDGGFPMPPTDAAVTPDSGAVDAATD